MPDGTPIGREYGLEENEALKKYFLDHVLGTEGYEEYLSTPKLQQLYDEGVLDDEGEKLYNDHLYSKWLTETYGKTEWQKFKDWVMTKEGMHTSLDVIGILLEPADALNAVLYLMEKDWGNAALSGISMLPFMGEQFGKAGKGTKKYLLKTADATKLNRNEKFVKMLDNLDIFIKARKADIEDIRRWMRSLENLADGGDYVIEYVTPDGLIYKVRMNDDFRVNINLMDEAGDTLQIEKRSSNNGKLEGNVIKKESKANLISNIDKDPRLVKAAEEMGKNERIQQEANHLISELLKGNENPGLGSKNLFKEVYYLRGRNGARIFYRKTAIGFEILGKADKANEQTVINILKKLYE